MSSLALCADFDGDEGQKLSSRKMMAGEVDELWSGVERDGVRKEEENMLGLCSPCQVRWTMHPLLTMALLPSSERDGSS